MSIASQTPKPVEAGHTPGPTLHNSCPYCGGVDWQRAQDLVAACDSAVQIIEQLIPEPSARGVAAVVLMQLRAALTKAGVA